MHWASNTSIKCPCYSRKMVKKKNTIIFCRFSYVFHHWPLISTRIFYPSRWFLFVSTQNDTSWASGTQEQLSTHQWENSDILYFLLLCRQQQLKDTAVLVFVTCKSLTCYCHNGSVWTLPIISIHIKQRTEKEVCYSSSDQLPKYKVHFLNIGRRAQS